ncbi:hypothetical protein CEXT_789551 [Caerostris extrusa]|uniref:Uncharacterized protein n=1 Tax=Caerostris extrusa TaxID=172846 RepID=A0AAV4M6V8_CAEEX|nr:hypothetical protein CEXT_789551 [Caerostris extrusa]
MFEEGSLSCEVRLIAEVLRQQSLRRKGKRTWADNQTFSRITETSSAACDITTRWNRRATDLKEARRLD